MTTRQKSTAEPVIRSAAWSGPQVFTVLEDGIAYVKEDGAVLNDPGSSLSLALVPQRYEQVVVECSTQCPGECIFVEYEDEPTAAALGAPGGTTFRPA